MARYSADRYYHCLILNVRVVRYRVLIQLEQKNEAEPAKCPERGSHPAPPANLFHPCLDANATRLGFTAISWGVSARDWPGLYSEREMSLGLDRARTRRRDPNAAAAIPTSPTAPHLIISLAGEDIGGIHTFPFCSRREICRSQQAAARPLALASVSVLGLVGC